MNNQITLFNSLLNNNIDELKFEVSCIVDMYKNNNVINTYIDCWFLTPKMMYSSNSEVFLNILFDKFSDLFNFYGVRIGKSTEEPYMLNGRFIIPIKIIDEALSTKIHEKKNELNKLLYYERKDREVYDKYSSYRDELEKACDSYYNQDSEHYYSKRIYYFKDCEINPFKSLEKIEKVIIKMNDGIEKNKSFFSKWFFSK